MVGNKAVGKLLHSQHRTYGKPLSHKSLFHGLSHELMGGQQGNLVQAKLKIGKVGDRYEQEADSVAERVVREMDSPQPQQTKLGKTMQSPALMCKTDGNGGGMATSPEFEASLNRERGRGQPLDKSIQEPMEQALGRDFSGVRVHANPSANSLNQKIGAKAFTTGRDVFFRQGTYQPSTQQGKRLIAHELTHVMQQSKAKNLLQRDINRDENEDSEIINDKIIDQIMAFKPEKYQQESTKQILEMQQLFYDEMAGEEEYGDW